MSQQEKPLSATERLARLEHNIFALDNITRNMMRSSEMQKTAITLLGRKVNAIVDLAVAAGVNISEDAIDQKMEENSIKELAEVVEEYKKAGQMIDSEVIDKDSFVVCREINKETGKLVNARLQFPFMDIDEVSQNNLFGKKKGDIVTWSSDDRFEVEILEVYKIVDTTTPPAPQPPVSE